MGPSWRPARCVLRPLPRAQGLRFCAPSFLFPGVPLRDRDLTDVGASRRTHSFLLQNGFGDVAYIGWVPLDLYRTSGALMRSEKEVHRHWPVPQQPEQDELVGVEQDAVAQILPVAEAAAQARKDRFRIQW